MDRHGRIPRIKELLGAVSLMIVSAACDVFRDSVEDGEMFGGSWLIPENEIRDGGPGIDGIPTVDDPEFAPAAEISYVPGNVRAYSHQIPDWHEIVNDRLTDVASAFRRGGPLSSHELSRAGQSASDPCR